jgi:hypothetical protein
MWRRITIPPLLVGAASGQLAAVYYLLVADNSEVYVEDALREFGNWHEVSEKTTTFRIHNPTQRTVRIIGLSFC